MLTVTEKRQTFRELHEGGCFVIPNPWDVGSARYLQGLGFKALASTSAGYAFTQGLPDNAVGRDRMLAHLRELCAAIDVPINADFEGGYAHEPEKVSENVRLCIETGVAGLSIEDSTGDPDTRLYDLDMAVARIRAARAAIDKGGDNTVFTGRTECFLVGRPDLRETIQRLKAYAAAGADCLYAPGIRTREQIDAVVTAVAPKPVNVLMSGALGMTVADLSALGVRRVSVGGGLARVGWGAMIRCAKQIIGYGTFDSFADAVPHPELNAFLPRGCEEARPAVTDFSETGPLPARAANGIEGIRRPRLKHGRYTKEAIAERAEARVLVRELNGLIRALGG